MLESLCPTSTCVALSLHSKCDQSRIHAEQQEKGLPGKSGEHDYAPDGSSHKENSWNQQPAEDARTCVFDLKSLKRRERVDSAGCPWRGSRHCCSMRRERLRKL